MNGSILKYRALPNVANLRLIFAIFPNSRTLTQKIIEFITTYLRESKHYSLFWSDFYRFYLVSIPFNQKRLNLESAIIYECTFYRDFLLYPIFESFDDKSNFDCVWQKKKIEGTKNCLIIYSSHQSCVKQKWKQKLHTIYIIIS